GGGRGGGGGDRYAPCGDQMNGFPPQRSLQTVGHVATDLLLDMDRLLADIAIEFHGGHDRFRRRLRAAHDLDQRDQMRRVEGMAEHAALRMLAPTLYPGDQEA